MGFEPTALVCQTSTLPIKLLSHLVTLYLLVRLCADVELLKIIVCHEKTNYTFFSITTNFCIIKSCFKDWSYNLTNPHPLLWTGAYTRVSMKGSFLNFISPMSIVAESPQVTYDPYDEPRCFWWTFTFFMPMMIATIWSIKGNTALPILSIRVGSQSASSGDKSNHHPTISSNFSVAGFIFGESDMHACDVRSKFKYLLIPVQLPNSNASS